MSEEKRLEAAQTLMRRTPPGNTVKSLAGLIEVCPDLVDELLTNIDQPLRVVKDGASGKEFVVCDYNRDGDGYRSPWTNKYFIPETGEHVDGFLPPAELRHLEELANPIFDVYRQQYFSNGLSSVYFFECDDGAFGAAFLIHKEVAKDNTVQKGVWDSTHIFHVAPTGKDKEFNYTITSTVLMSMNLKEAVTGNVDLSGSLTSQSSKIKTADKPSAHIVNMGQILENAEGLLRTRIESIYIQKTREVLSGARNSTGQRDAMWADIANSLKNSLPKRKD